MKLPVDSNICDLLNSKLKALENHFDADVLSFSGPLIDGTENLFLSVVEALAQNPKNGKKETKIVVFLTTQGGSAVAVERYVHIIRKHYTEVHFIVPDYAYSAGTIFCMSGDTIHMDYFSVLGPIDPQVKNKEGKLVAALGYLDKVNALVEKAKKGELTNAEFLILKDIDLAELRGYEQAKELTIDLLKKWLVTYKFKNWDSHRSDPKLKGQKVTDDQKIERARKIADQLSDNNIWKSHGRPINIDTVVNELKLEVEDYSNQPVRRALIRDYYGLLSDYIRRNQAQIFVHTRNFI